MWHATFMEINQGNFRLLMVESQIGNLIPDLSFGHNLCFKYLNGSSEPILDIYISRTFQWYKELFNPMSFDSYNCLLKIQESIRSPTPKVGAHLGMCWFIPSHFPTQLGARICDSWASLLARTFVGLCFGCEPKVRVTTLYVFYFNFFSHNLLFFFPLIWIIESILNY